MPPSGRWLSPSTVRPTTCEFVTTGWVDPVQVGVLQEPAPSMRRQSRERVQRVGFENSVMRVSGGHAAALYSLTRPPSNSCLWIRRAGRRTGAAGCSSGGLSESERCGLSVVVGGVEAEHVLQVAAVDDQNPVEALPAEGADPTLGIGVRVWGSDRRADDLHVLAAEELIEGATEFAVAVVEQEPEGLLPVGEEHRQVSRLLCDPAPIRVACARDELDPTTLERDEEQDVDAGQPDRLDR